MRSPDSGTTHIIGAGLAGLAAAVRLADSGRAIVVHEATAQPGGRCRSYYDRSTGMVIDNGTHLVLSGNRAVLDYARTIGGADSLQQATGAVFAFIDMASRTRWTVRISEGRIPWWVLSKRRRVPQTRLLDYLSLMRLMWVSADKPLSEVIDCTGTLYQRLTEPFLLAALNIAPAEGSAKLASTLVRETLAAGGEACRPLIAREGIGRAFVEPAIDYLDRRGVTVSLEHALHELRFGEDRVTELVFGGGEVVTLGRADAAILTVPAYAARGFLPGLQAPSSFRGIFNVHFRCEPPPDAPPMIGLINAASQWVFSFPGRIAVTISDAGKWFDVPREQVAQAIWNEVAAVLGLPTSLPPWQIVRERRATFAATPEENAKRPGQVTRWRNLFLAGDWTATGLPATLEGAVRSGNAAADLVRSSGRVTA
jgi:squalene-associated FAD-dependent desaturase